MSRRFLLEESVWPALSLGKTPQGRRRMAIVAENEQIW